MIQSKVIIEISIKMAKAILQALTIGSGSGTYEDQQLIQEFKEELRKEVGG